MIKYFSDGDAQYCTDNTHVAKFDGDDWVVLEGCNPDMVYRMVPDLREVTVSKVPAPGGLFKSVSTKKDSVSTKGLPAESAGKSSMSYASILRGGSGV